MKNGFYRIFTDFLIENNIKGYSQYSSLGAVFAEKINRTIRDLLRRPVFESEHGIRVDIRPTMVKQYNNKIHSSTKLTWIEGPLKRNEGFAYENLLDNRKKKFKIHDFVRTANLKKTFSKGDTTNWLDKLYEIKENITDTIPSYRIDKLPERYNQALLKKQQS